MNQEVVIYIHGITPDEKLATIAKAKDFEDLRSIHEPENKAKVSHENEYMALRSGISQRIKDDAKQASWDQAVHCFTEWGWEYQESDAANLGASHRLADAQHELGQRVLRAIKDAYWIKFIPLPIRKLTLYGMSDIFYYVSHDGRASIRARICHQIASQLRDILDEPSINISLTLLGHSAGSVIALDLVSYLFTDDELFMEELIEQARNLEKSKADAEKQRRSEGGLYRKIDAVIDDSLDFVEGLMKLKSAKNDGRLTLKSLVTMGSPVSMMALRSDRRIKDLAYGGSRVSLESLGLKSSSDEREDDCWINIWNKSDPISFPVKPMMEESNLVKDFCVRVLSLNPIKWHTGYWSSKKVQRLLARKW